MKKFLTVLLVIAVMFTFSFSSAFAATPNDNAADSQEAFNELVTKALKTLSYDGNGYVTNGNEAAKGYLSKTAIESYSAILQAEYLSKIGSAKADWDNEWADVNTTDKYVAALFTGKTWELQADLDKDAAYAALAPDLSGYSAAAKAEIQKVIDAQTVVLETAIASKDSGTIIIKSREVVAAVKQALKDNATTADDTKTIEKAKSAAVKALNDKAPDFLEAAEKAYENAVDTTSAARKATLNDDYDKMVKYFEDVIAECEKTLS